MKKTNHDKINFDNYTAIYENQILKSFEGIDNNLSYYHEGKAKIARRELSHIPNKILDFGCGIGLLLRHLKKNFNKSEFFAYDESIKSLEQIKLNFPDVSCLKNIDDDQKFDLIVVSNVIHHVKSGERNSFFQKISKLLDKNGQLLIFEHNPFNPVTLKVVANCEFDADAELIKKNDLIKLCFKNNFEIEKSGYIHFFPSKLKFFFNFEKYLKWFFLGAQYFCIFRKIS